jgi:ElaB/YqjD/DUF883 family membrane-anchored ribosome-binding protein
MENEQGLVKVEGANGKDETQHHYVDDFRAQAQEYGQKVQDAALKAKEFASEKYAIASEKFNELKSKDPKELVEEAKEFARQKPGQAIMISAAAGLIIGWLLRRK